MKKLFLLYIVLIGLVFSTNFTNLNSYSSSNIANFTSFDDRNIEISDNLKILRIDDMSRIIGSCGGGGTCYYYFHSCSYACTHHDANQCSGSTGNCINKYEAM